MIQLVSIRSVLGQYDQENAVGMCAHCFNLVWHGDAGKLPGQVNASKCHGTCIRNCYGMGHEARYA